MGVTEGLCTRHLFFQVIFLFTLKKYMDLLPYAQMDTECCEGPCGQEAVLGLEEEKLIGKVGKRAGRCQPSKVKAPLGVSSVLRKHRSPLSPAWGARRETRREIKAQGGLVAFGGLCRALEGI